ncbi:FxLYD domain-containing protein [candidate division KSB1 bacterium]
MLLFAACAVILVFMTNTSRAQGILDRQIKNPKVEIVDKILDTKDSFGRKRFAGNVQNKEAERIDYIKISFSLYNKEGDLLGTAQNFIKGKFHQFEDFQISTSSLDPKQIGTFDIITSVSADSVYSFTYKIEGVHFIFK